MLMGAGAAVNKQTEDGWTALMIAARHGGKHAAGMVRLLVDAGADANTQDKDGNTALMVTAQFGGESTSRPRAGGPDTPR